MSDVDGTLSRIVDRPDHARVPARARESLETLAGHLGLVACVTGRMTGTVRKLVGAEGVTYFGNHGLGLLRPGAEEPEVIIDAEDATRAPRFIAANDNPVWVEAKIRIEDKGPIQALHWRGAGPRTEVMVEEIAAQVEEAGLSIHWGRKVLEIRPPGMAGKAGAVDVLLEDTDLDTVVFAGDDRTDLEAAIRLRELTAEGRLKRAVIVAVASDEGPVELVEMADIVVEEPEEWIEMLGDLAAKVAGETA